MAYGNVPCWTNVLKESAFFLTTEYSVPYSVQCISLIGVWGVCTLIPHCGGRNLSVSKRISDMSSMYIAATMELHAFEHELI